MKLAFRHSKAGVLLLALTVGSCAEADLGALEPDSDNATLRRAAFNEWYNEASTGGDRYQGGSWSVDYRQFVLQTAALEKLKWGSQIPDGSRVAAGELASDSWTNLGPDRADYLQNGGFTLPVTDSGRLRSIVVDPTNPQTRPPACATSHGNVTDAGSLPLVAGHDRTTRFASGLGLAGAQGVMARRLESISIANAAGRAVQVRAGEVTQGGLVQGQLLQIARVHLHFRFSFSRCRLKCDSGERLRVTQFTAGCCQLEQ